MIITGNLAKVHIIEELGKMFAAAPQRMFRILDVGITGPEPLNFWEPLFRYPNFELDGIDIDASSIEALKKTALPPQVKRLEALSGYDVLQKFGPASFDIVVSTQVLEHMKHPERCLAAVAGVLKPDGVFYLCYDNGDYPRKENHLKELAKDLVVRLTGSERYHDKDLPSADVRRMLVSAGFEIADARFYNLHPLKAVHNRETPDDKKNALIAEWKRFEDYLNASGHAATHPERYLVAYFKAVKK